MTQEYIKNLLKDMTLKEKLGEMTQIPTDFLAETNAPAAPGPLTKSKITKEDLIYIGSCYATGAARVRAIQEKHMKEHPHHIPLVFTADIIYSYHTVFPIPLAMSCSFNPALYTLATSVIAKEASADGVQVTFAPMADLVRDPRWGRVMESPGEDPYLNAQMISAAVKGFQGDDPKAPGKLGSCVKHFAAYSASEAGRDYNSVDMSKGTFCEYYLSGYKAAIDAGCKMVMTSFNILDRVPSGANKEVYQDILRDMLKFKGVVISDYAAADETIEHGFSADAMEVAEHYLPNCDIELVGSDYYECAEQLIKEGRLSMEDIDKAVLRILNLKNDLGLFENPYKDADPELVKKLGGCEEHLKAAREVASRSIVLLQNNNKVLPLCKHEHIKIGIAGPFTDTIQALGGWALPEAPVVTLLEGMQRKFPNAEIVTAMTGELGAMQDGIFDVEDCVAEAVERLKDCDIIISAIGEHPLDTGESASRTILRMSDHQEKLVRELHRLGKPTVTLVFSGRPLEIRPLLPYTDAMVQCWFLGVECGNAIADVLSGDWNPSGKLSMSFPQTVGQIPVYYNHYNTGRPAHGKRQRYVSCYLDCPNEPLYPFGFGLSYSEFAFSDFLIKTQGETVKASVTVENVSDIAGTETVQLYIRDVAAQVVRPVKELKGFRQVNLEAHEKATVEFTITRDTLSFIGRDCKPIFEHGDFDIMIGNSSDNVMCERITL